MVLALTVGGLRRRVAARLRAAFEARGHAGTPDLDSRLLVAHALRCDPNHVVLGEDRAIDAAAEAQAMAYAERRASGEPVARIVGRQEFYGLDFRLGPATLVPRPDTETLVDAALAFVRREGRLADTLTVLDVGTGSGAILLALLSQLPNASGVGVDLLAGAASTARENAHRFGLEDRAAFVVGEWLSPIGARFDIVVANPPYVASGEIEGLEPEVKEHEPALALDGGAGGLAAFDPILRNLADAIAPGGAGFLEFGATQGAAVAGIAERAGFEVSLFRDLAGLERVAGLRRPAEAPISQCRTGRAR